MEAEFAFLAESVQKTPLGRLNIKGGGITVLDVPGFPTLFNSTMALVFCIRAAPSECDIPHRLHVEIWDEQAGPLFKGIPIDLNVLKNPLLPDRDSTVLLDYTVPRIQYNHKGEYEFRLLINGSVKATVRVLVAESDAAQSRVQFPRRS